MSCHLCHRDTAYTDVLGMEWCDSCWDAADAEAAANAREAWGE